jgi:ATP-dependent DNA ligase
MMVYDIIESVAKTSSKLEKLAILKRNKDNETLKEVIRLAYNPFIKFWIKKIPAIIPSTENQSLEWAISSLDALYTRKYTGNEALDYLGRLMGLVTKEDAEIVARVVGKDLRAGFSESTANKIWPKLIPEYPCMLCSTYEQKLVDKINFPAYFQTKEDGMRFNAHVINGMVSYFSRNGKPIYPLPVELDEAFRTMANVENVIFDGELLIGDGKGGYLERKTGNGILQRAVKGKATAEDLRETEAVLWDVIADEKAFWNGEHSVWYRHRFELLQRMFSRTKSTRIKIVESHDVNSIEEVQALYKDYLDTGQEGGILKDKRGIWEDKRSKSQIKFKAELDCDLVCVGWNEGKGKYTGLLGALQLESSDGLIKVNIGSGFSDKQRKEIGKDVVGKIVSLKYNARITNKKTNQDSLFLPIVKEIRYDKSVADSSKRIK